MASIEVIKQLHLKVGEMPAHAVSDTMLRWYKATTKYIIREEQKLLCQTQPIPQDPPEVCGIVCVIAEKPCGLILQEQINQSQNQ